jgi:hypothetical protein
MSHWTYLYADDPQCSGERQLIAAMLRLHRTDAQYQGQNVIRRQQAEEAQRWLRNRDAVVAWLTLAGLPEAVYDELLAAIQRPAKERRR